MIITFFIIFYYTIIKEVKFYKKNIEKIKSSIFYKKPYKNARAPIKEIIEENKSYYYKKAIVYILIPSFMIIYPHYN
jgi:hypothetical protein